MSMHIVDDEQRRDRPQDPCAPRRCAPTSPASRCLASTPAALGTRPIVLSPRAARYKSLESEVPTAKEGLCLPHWMQPSFKEKIMNKTQLLVSVTLGLSIVVFILTIGDFLALHDISKDYVSKFILDYLQIELSQELPEWTDTRGEWRSVTISFVSRFAFLILNFVTLSICLRRLREPA
jgi:hypothetical protein